MSDSDDHDLRVRLAEWEAEHRALDHALDVLAAQPICDALAVRRLKKRKLALKDMIARARSRMIPDLDA